MSGAWHDTGVLLVTAVIDMAILVAWQVMGSSLFDRDSEVPAAGPAQTAADQPPLLHRVTSMACLFLLVGLIIESSGLAVVIAVRFGFSR